RRRHTRFSRDWSSDVCSSDLLSDAKRTLVVSRLSKILRALGLPSFDAYLDYLDRGGSAKDGQDFVNALTTNLTRFYREDHHFERSDERRVGIKDRLRVAQCHD